MRDHDSMDGGAATPPPHSGAAYAEVHDELARLRADELVAVNVYVPEVAVRVVGVAPTLLTLLPDMRHLLPHHPLENVERLATYALAAWFAHLRARGAASHAHRIARLVQEARARRADLLAAARRLAAQRLLATTDGVPLQPTRGHLGLAADLVALAELLAKAIDALGPRAGVEPASLDRATALGQELLRAVAGRDTADRSERAHWTQQTARAFTLLARAYDSARRAVAYVRWEEGDAERLLPPLGAMRGGLGRGRCV